MAGGTAGEGHHGRSGDTAGEGSGVAGGTTGEYLGGGDTRAVAAIIPQRNRLTGTRTPSQRAAFRLACSTQANGAASAAGFGALIK